MLKPAVKLKIVYLMLFIAVLACLYYFITKKGRGGVAALPEIFTQYQSLDSAGPIRSGKTEMALLFESTLDIWSFLTPDNHIIICTFPGKKSCSFFKIAPDGHVADSFTIDARPEDMAFVKGFIIDKEQHQYYKWSFNGSKQPLEITPQNAQFDWNTDRQERQLAAIATDSVTVFVDYKFDSPPPQKQESSGLQTTQAVNTYAVLTYFTGEDCFRFYTALNVHGQFPYSRTENALWSNLFKQADNKIVPTPAIQYRHFQKQPLEKVRFSGGGGNVPGFTKMLYPGHLFTDVICKHDTLRLKEFMYLDEEWHTAAVTIDGHNIGALSKNKAQPPEIIRGYMYYTNPALSYALFCNSDRKIYMIK